MSTLRRCWKKLKKVPILGWLAFVVIALVVAVILFFRKGGGLVGIFRTTPESIPSGPATPITQEEAEEAREEISENLQSEEDVICSEADQLRKKIEEKFGEPG